MDDFDFAVVVAVIAMGMVKMPVDDVVDVVTMGNRFVTAAGAMDVARLMSRTCVIRCADVRVRGGNLDHMFIDVIAMGMMQMAIMDIVDMIAMAHGRVSAARAVLVIMICVVGKCALVSHCRLSSMNDSL